MSWFRKKEEDVAPPLPSPASLQGGVGGGVGGGKYSPAAEAIAENFKAYTMQLNSVSAQCWEKCMAKKQQADLTIGELSCDDRCVLKYLATTTKVAEVFQGLMAAGGGAPGAPPAQ